MDGEIPTIFIDTAFLRGTSLEDTKFRSLLQHSKNGNVTIFISRIVLEEWRTQKITHALKKLQDFEDKRSIFNQEMKSNFCQRHLEFPFITATYPTKEQIQEASKNALSQFIEDYKIKIVSIEPDHPERAWQLYFDFRTRSQGP